MARRKDEDGSNVVPLFDDLRTQVFGPDHKTDITAIPHALRDKGFHAIEHALTEQERAIARSVDASMKRPVEFDDDLKLYAFTHSAFCTTSLLHDRHPFDPGFGPKALLDLAAHSRKRRKVFDDACQQNTLFDIGAITEPDIRPAIREDRDISYTAKAGKYELFMQPLLHPFEERYFGLPYGIYGRLVLLYLQTECCREGSEIINVGSSISAFCKRIGLEPNTRIRYIVADQINRLASTHFTLKTPGSRRGQGRGLPLLPPENVDDSIAREDLMVPFQIVEASSYVRMDEFQAGGWIKNIKLNGDFVKALTNCPVSVEESVISELKGSSYTLDIYLWLAFRLHALKEPERLSWPQIMQQFGMRNTRQNRHDFKNRHLAKALLAYPQANIMVDEKGMVICPSDPPVNVKRVREKVSATRKVSSLRQSRTVEPASGDLLEPKKIA